jgi:hypothetical protein
MSKLRQTLFIILLVTGLAGCTAKEPRQIAAYPQEGSVTVAQYIPVPPAQVVYNAYLQVEVANTERAAEDAQALAEDYGGYMVSSTSWRSDGHKHYTVVLAVPAPNFEGLLAAVEDLGTLQSEQITGGWENLPYGGEWQVYSQITVELSRRAIAWPDLSIGGWNPGRTLENALGVSVTIFGFLIDVLIWVVVVIGPFALIGLGVRALLRRTRRPC